MNTTNEAIPPHVAVRTSEQSITGWRQHSLRHFGDGRGRWKWSPPTTEPLDKSGWLDEKMPTTYSVRTLVPCCKHQRGFDVECNHCSIKSAPVLVDTKAAGVPAGSISHLGGFVPVGAPSTVQAALDADELITEDQAEMIQAAYETARARTRARRLKRQKR
jgi:hypothetical protein